MTDYNWLLNFLDWLVEDFTRLLVISALVSTIIVYGPIVARKLSSRNQRGGSPRQRR